MKLKHRARHWLGVIVSFRGQPGKHLGTVCKYMSKIKSVVTPIVGISTFSVYCVGRHLQIVLSWDSL